MFDWLGLTLQIAASATTVLAMWLMGNRSLWGPAMGVVSEVVWGVVIVYSALWGLLPLCLFLVVVNARNWMKWRRDDKAHARAREKEEHIKSLSYLWRRPGSDA